MTPSAAHRRKDPTGLAPLIDRLDAWFEASRCFPELEHDRELIRGLLDRIHERQASLETPLRIVLLGGTGVGKSTLFNALGGADLATAAAVRPTTRELTAYFHEENGPSALGDLAQRTKLQPHDRELLRDKIVIDAPDFDSTEEENRRLLEKTLEVTDLALCVVTGEKYLSGELFGLLEKYREGIEYVFVLNKLDRSHQARLLVEDLRKELNGRGLGRSRILAVSALRVRSKQLEAEDEGLPVHEVELPREAGQWPELRNLLEHELDKVRIREIKAAKLADRVRGVLARMQQRLPAEVPERVEGWRSTWAASRLDLTGDLSRTFFGAIHHDFELRNLLRYLFGTAFSGIFGVFMTVVYGVRSVLMPGYTRARRFTTPDLEALIGERLRSVEIQHVERRVRVVLERFAQEGRRLGFASAVLDDQRDDLGERVARLVVAVRSEAARRFFDIFQETAGTGDASRKMDAIAWNALPITVVVFTGWAFLASLFPHEKTTLGERIQATPQLLEGGLIYLLVTCLAQWPVAERKIDARIQHSLVLLEQVVERAVEECLGDAVVRAPEEFLERILSTFREFEAMQRDAEQVLPDPSSRTPVLPTHPSLPTPPAEPPSPDPQATEAPAAGSQAGDQPTAPGAPPETPAPPQ